MFPGLSQSVWDCFLLLPDYLFLSLYFVLLLKNMVIRCVIPGSNLLSVGEADGFWGGSEKRKAAACGSGFTVFH